MCLKSVSALPCKIRVIIIILCREQKEVIPSDVVWIAIVGVVADHVIARNGTRKPHDTVTLRYYPAHIPLTNCCCCY